MGTVRSFDWLVSSIFKLNQILENALWNCFRENTFHKNRAIPCQLTYPVNPPSQIFLELNK